MKLRIILMCILLSLLAVPCAFALDLGGTISGRVTDANSQPLANMFVQFYNTGGTSPGNTVAKQGVTDSSGNYSVAAIPSGTYKVVFFGSNNSGAPYVQKWYNNAAGYSTATGVTLTSGSTSSNINAVLSTVAAPKVDLGTVTKGTSSVVKIPVTLTTNGAAISSVGVSVTFDPNKFDNISYIDPNDSAMTVTTARGAATIAANKALTAQNIVINNDGTATYSAGVLSTENTNVIGDGVILNLYCTLASSVTSGPVTLANGSGATDPSGASIANSAGTAGTINFPDATKPVVTAFTIPATSVSTIVAVNSLTATDNVAVTGYLITESSTKPLATASGWSTTVPSSYNNITSDGVKTLYAWAKDAAGNVSDQTTYSTASITIDATKPTLSQFTMPATATSLTVSITTLTATDNVGVAGYYLSESSSTPLASANGWVTTKPTSFTFSAGGTRTVYAWVKDALGNVNVSNPVKQATVTITLPDAEAPTVSVFAIPATGTSLTVPITTFTATDNIGVAGYKITESSTAPAASATGWTSTAPASYTVTGDVPQGVSTSVTLYAWVKDAANNVSAAVTGTSAAIDLTIPDTTKPVITGFSIPSTATTATVAVTTLTATDNRGVIGFILTESATEPAPTDNGWSSVAPTNYTFSGIPQGVATPKTLYAWAKDLAGNVSLSSSAQVSITLTGPALTFNQTVLATGTATKNNALDYRGTVTGVGTVSLTLAHNGQSTTVTIQQDHSFSVPVQLVEGDNTLVATASDDNGTTTDTRTITLNPNLADLAVTNPATNNSFTKNTTLDLTGTVGAPQSTTVTVALNGGNAQTATLSGDNFIVQLTLAQGANTIVVTATDTVTGTHTQTIGITSDPSAPTLAVTAPALPFFTPKNSIVLTGTASDTLTTPTVSITVDGVALENPVITAGAFSATIALPTVKQYAVVVTATDQSGNSSVVSGNIVRKDPSGNATDGVSAPALADVQKALNFALGLETPTSDELVNMDVAPLSSGKPSPDGVIDAGDALVILEKIVGKVAW